MRLLSRPASQFSQTQITRTLSTVAVALVGVVLLSSPPLVAQFTTASLGGTVIDPSGAAVPNAKVGVRNKDTALTRSVESASDGGFLFSSLPVGTYRLTVEKAGFATYVQDGIELTLNQAASVPVTLKVGQATEEITVTANAELVVNRDATVGQLVDQKRVADLPLNGRQAQSLV